MAIYLKDSSQRQVYLITYSRADLILFPSREVFADAILDAWTKVSKCNVLHWVVAREKHQVQDGNPTRFQSDFHYHMALKLEKKSRWLRVRNYVETTSGIKINFSDHHANYYSAYKYVTKEDENSLHSPDHPVLTDVPAPRTTNATLQVKSNKGKKTKKRSRAERLTVFDVTEIIRDQSIKTRVELLAFAERQKLEGKTNLAAFIANRGSRIVNEALVLAKEFSEAEASRARSLKSRIQLLTESLNESCVEGCEKRWLALALELLNKNGIDVSSYCNSIYQALKLGRGKHRNVYIHGNTNCGKTFMIAPLKCIYTAFVNPASGTFAWLGAEQAEIIILNDFRWSPAIIAWSDFLQILEGDTMHLAAPKNSVAKDILFDKDTPFFATADAPLVLVRGGSICTVNTDMMKSRWRCFQFSWQVPQEDQIEVKPCGRCFAELILSNKTFD